MPPRKTPLENVTAFYSDTILMKAKEAIERLFLMQFEALVEKHIGPVSEIPVVMYKGTKYRTSTPLRTALVLEKAATFKTEESLIAMQQVLNWRTTQLQKLKSVQQVLSRIISESEVDDQSLRNAIPDSLVPFASASVSVKERTVPWLETIKNPMLKAQAQGLEKHMDFLSVVHLTVS